MTYAALLFMLIVLKRFVYSSLRSSFILSTICHDEYSTLVHEGRTSTKEGHLFVFVDDAVEACQVPHQSTHEGHIVNSLTSHIMWYF